MKGVFNETRAFGVEIEYSRPHNVSNQAIATQLSMMNVTTHVEEYNHSTRPHWKIVSDSSVWASTHTTERQIGRNELVSPLLFGKDGLEQITKVCELLQSLGCTVNYSCGLHVHHDVRAQITHVPSHEAKAHIEKLVKWVSKFEHCIYKLIAPSRLDDRNYSVPVRKYFSAKGYEIKSVMQMQGARKNSLIKDSVKDVVDNKSGSGARYLQQYRPCGLNLYHIFGRGSVEFRYHQGTINASKITNWVILTQMILSAVESKRSVSLKKVESGTVGMAKFRKALGLGTVKNDFNSQVNDYVKKTYKKFSKRENDYLRHPDYNNYVKEGF